jgi:hypothetical protein
MKYIKGMKQYNNPPETRNQYISNLIKRRDNKVRNITSDQSVQSDQIPKLILDSFVKKYDKMVDDFMNLEDRSINTEMSNKWIKSQPIKLLQEAAEFFIKNVRHIQKNEVIKAIEATGDKIIELGVDKCVVLFVYGTSKKSNNSKDPIKQSNYYFTIFVLAYIYKQKTEIPVVSDNFGTAYIKYGSDKFYIDIDDMAYTGSQTEQLLINYLRSFNVEGLNNERDNIFYKYLYLKENVKYYVFRLFTTNDANKTISHTEDYVFLGSTFLPKFPVTLFYYEEIPNSKNIAKTDEEKMYYYAIRDLLNLSTPSATWCYFDYKIADISSTFLFPLATGYVPSTKFLKFYNDLIYDKKVVWDKQEQYYNYVDRITNEIKSISSEKPISYSPFISGCKNTKNIFDILDDKPVIQQQLTEYITKYKLELDSKPIYEIFNKYCPENNQDLEIIMHIYCDYGLLSTVTSGDTPNDTIDINYINTCLVPIYKNYFNGNSKFGTQKRSNRRRHRRSRKRVSIRIIKP